MTKNIESFIDDQSSQRYGNDVPEYMLHSERQETGVFFGTKRINNRITYVGKPTDEDGHVLVVGGAGSGKSSCVAIPTLETWGGTFFAIDIKGELSKRWNELPGEKRPSKIFNLSKDQGVFSSYDPFHFLRQDGEENLVQNAREIAHAIIPLPPNVLEPFWIQSAQHILTATILHGFEIKASFNATMTRILTVPIWELLDEIKEGNSNAAKMHINQFKDIENPAENKMLTGISAELCNKVIVFVTNLQIKDSFTPTEDSVNWEDLESHNIFMRIAEDKLGQWDGAITLMLTQLIRSLERRHDKRYTPEGKPQVLSASDDPILPTLLLLDEFPRLGKVDVIQNAVSTLRSKGVTICIMMQSLAQLDRTYGKETRQIIVDNCQYKAILQVTDPENQKIFSDMIGTIKVGMKGTSANTGDSKSESEDAIRRTLEDRLTGNQTNIESKKSVTTGTTTGNSQTVTESREPAIHPHELAALDDILLLTPKGFCRVDKAPYYQSNKSTSSNEARETSRNVDFGDWKPTVKPTQAREMAEDIAKK